MTKETTSAARCLNTSPYNETVRKKVMQEKQKKHNVKKEK
jgi:hypothetical protein